MMSGSEGTKYEDHGPAARMAVRKVRAQNALSIVVSLILLAVICVLAWRIGGM